MFLVVSCLLEPTERPQWSCAQIWHRNQTGRFIMERHILYWCCYKSKITPKWILQQNDLTVLNFFDNLPPLTLHVWSMICDLPWSNLYAAAFPEGRTGNTQATPSSIFYYGRGGCSQSSFVLMPGKSASTVVYQANQSFDQKFNARNNQPLNLSREMWIVYCC